MSKKTSLKQFLMKCGRFEKVYDCEQAVRNGRVSINNKTITNPNYFFNSKNALVKFENEKIKPITKLYFLMNKPAGYLSQKSGNEKSIYDLLEKLNLSKESIKSLFAVGRLDKDTEGLMILTNDGRLPDKILQPENEIGKKYYAILEKPADKSRIKSLEKGVKIEIDGETYTTKPCKIKIAGEKESYITISEGRKRQIRKMFEAIGNKVVYLKRVSIGGLQLGDLKAGEFRQLTREEILEKLEY
ncbi:rRNA pseudouridine synthase [Candidatus Woesearchaeota archaeon]|nr:rRNA pseudouridine synthase [Candidatus Woesearchaeota archaeon]